MSKAIALASIAFVLGGCSYIRSPLTLRTPFVAPELPDLSDVLEPFAVLPAGSVVVWDYPPSAIVSGCPDPSNPQLDPGCEVSFFRAWDGSSWLDAGMSPGPTPSTFQFVYPGTVDEAVMQVQACNDIGTTPGVWDSGDGCSSMGGRLYEIVGPVNPRFLP